MSRNRKLCVLVLVAIVTLGLFASIGSAQEKVKLTFWHWWGVDREPLMEKMVSEFTETYPWIEVEHVVQPWDRREERVLTAFAGGQPPDVIMAQRYEIPQYVAKNLIIPIDGYIEKHNVDLHMFYESEIGSFIIDGKVWTLPMPTGGATRYILIYNKDIFAEVGLPDRAPETWQEVYEWSEKLTIRNDDGSLKRIGINMSGPNLFLPLLYSNNGRYLSDDMKTILWNSPEGLATLKFMAEHTINVNGGPENVTGFYADTSGEAANAPFYTGVECMAWHNVSVFFHIQNLAPNLNYGVGIMPYNADNPSAEGHGVVTDGWGYVIPKAVPEEKREAAFLFVDWLTTKEQAAGWFMMQQMRPSPVKAFNENPKYWEINPNWDTVIKSLEADVSIPLSPSFLEIQDVINQMVELATYGRMTPEEALAWGAEEAQNVVDDFWFFQ